MIAADSIGAHQGRLSWPPFLLGIRVEGDRVYAKSDLGKSTSCTVSQQPEVVCVAKMCMIGSPMAYDWNGVRADRARRIKLAAWFLLLLLAIIVLAQVVGPD